MAYLIGFRVVSGLSGMLLSAAALATSGCSTADVAPPLSPYDQAAVAAGRGPIDTGTFPNLNVPQKAATRQFTDDETEAKLAALQAEQNRQAPPAGTSETPEQRRKRLQLLSDQQDDTLKVIESN